MAGIPGGSKMQPGWSALHAEPRTEGPNQSRRVFHCADMDYSTGPTRGSRFRPASATNRVYPDRQALTTRPSTAGGRGSGTGDVVGLIGNLITCALYIQEFCDRGFDCRQAIAERLSAVLGARECRGLDARLVACSSGSMRELKSCVLHCLSTCRKHKDDLATMPDVARSLEELHTAVCNI